MKEACGKFWGDNVFYILIGLWADLHHVIKLSLKVAFIISNDTKNQGKMHQCLSFRENLSTNNCHSNFLLPSFA